jgi:S-adenosylmethionine:tRNA ribosyltransferase-isomerase
LNVSDFSYDLPVELIAQAPAPRGTSRLLVLDRAAGTLQHVHVRDLPRFLRSGDVLVANDTRVFPARLLGRRVSAASPSAGTTPPSGVVECLLLARESSSASGEQIWYALMHPGQKLKPGTRARFESPGGGVLMAEVLERQFFGRRRIRLWVEGQGNVDDLVDAIGHVPLPPYIHRADTPEDRDRYQTIFAAVRGSVAAPTAGLHFDRALLDTLSNAGVEQVAITLHVGYGTFKPVRAETVEEHTVDPEPYAIGDAAAAVINQAVDEGRRIVAVGTTTTRALEDAVCRGGGRVMPGANTAEIFIYPGFDFRIVRGLLTNFHLPRSSLLMLVSALAGRERVLDAYRTAVTERYRFYSYGDAMLVL